MQAFFDLTLFKKGIKRTLPLTLTHLVVWLFAMPVLMVNMMEYNEPLLNISEYVYMTVHIGGTLMSFFFCAAVLAVQNNYMYTARSVSFYHALPVHRSTIFVTNLLVTLAGLLVPMILVGGLTWIVELTHGLGAGWIYIFKWFLMYTAMCLFFTGFFSLCSHITGHIAAAPIIYAILNFTSVVVEAIVRYIPSLFLYGVQQSSSLTTQALSPIWYIYTECSPMLLRDDIEHLPYKLIYEGSWYLAVLAVVGVLFMGLAWLFYKNRKSESAGEFIAIPALRPVFKYCVTAGFALVLSIIFYSFSYQIGSDDQESIFWYTVCVLMAGAIGYFGSEMVLRKTLRVFKTSWKGFAASVLCMLLCCSILAFDLLGIESWVPDMDEVEALYIQAARWDYPAKLKAGDDFLPDALELHRQILDNKEANQADWQASRNDYNVDRVFSSISLEYTMKDGSLVFRSYRLPLLEYTNGERTEYKDLYGFTAALTDLHSKQTIIERAYDGIFDAAEPFNIYHASAYRYAASKEYVLSHTAYIALEDALRQDLLDGTLVPPALEGVTTNGPMAEAWEITSSGPAIVDTEAMANPYGGNGQPYEYSLNLDMEALHENEQGFRSNRYYRFDVTPAAANTWAVLEDPASYQEIPVWE